MDGPFSLVPLSISLRTNPTPAEDVQVPAYEEACSKCRPEGVQSSRSFPYFAFPEPHFSLAESLCSFSTSQSTRWLGQPVPVGRQPQSKKDLSVPHSRGQSPSTESVVPRLVPTALSSQLVAAPPVPPG